MQVRVLGAIEVADGGAAVPITSRSQRVVLAVLAARAGAVVSADVLVDALWGDGAPPSATSSLRTYVSRLRSVLGDRIEGSAAGYRLVAPAELDAVRFEQLLDEAQDPVVALERLEAALALWRGRPFGDADDVDPVRPAAARLVERWLDARERRAAALLAVGRAAEAVAAAEELLAEHPLREGAWGTLVAALGATARPTEALRAHQRAVEVLAEAGLTPGPELRRAEAAVLAADRLAEMAGRRPLPPPPRSSFVGRGDDRRALADIVVERPLVTLLGPGGVGKTRLARTVAADVADRFAWGARLVELAGVDDPDRVAAAIAGALGLTVGAEGPEAALAAAGDLDLLVVVDDCEHVIEAAARAISRLLAGGTRARVLATSREPLGIAGEQRWPVAPLPITGDGGAERLFLDRAGGARPGFDPVGDEAALVREICERLDGLPLAIEVAAAALGVLPVAELADRLATSGPVPAPPRRTGDPRHRTLDAVVGWSVRLLDPEDARLLTDVAVFAGWVGAEDVAAVTEVTDALLPLCRLAERSLLVTDAGSDRARFRMLATVRRSLLGSGSHHELRYRHAQWIVDATADADRSLQGADEVLGHNRIEALLDDARAALTWCLEHDLATAVEIAANLALFGQSRVRDEVLAWSDEVASRLPRNAAGAEVATVLAAAAHRTTSRGDLAAGRTLAERAVVAGGRGAPAIAFEVLSDALMFAGDLVAAEEAAIDGLTRARGAGDSRGAVICAVNVALNRAYRGDHVGAGEVLVEVAADARTPSARAWLRYGEGERLLDRDPPAALAALDEAIAEATACGNRYVESVARVSGASVRSRTGDPAAARAPFAEVLVHWRGIGDRTHLLTTLRNLVVLLQRLDQPERAAELLGTVLDDRIAATYGDEERLLAETLDDLRDRLGAAQLEQRMAAGTRRSLEEAGRLAEAWLEEPLYR